METLLKDVRVAARTLAKQPAFTATVVLILAVAIGSSTAIFSLVESTLLRPLPWGSPGRLAFLWGVAGPQRAVRGGSLVEVEDWARLNRSFEAIAVYDETSLNLLTAEGAERVDAEMVSAAYFPLLGTTAALGRTFTAVEDSVPDAHPVVVMSDDLWRTRFGADPGILGRTVTLNNLPFTVLGVMPPGFNGLSFDADLWFPAMMVRANGGPADLSSRDQRWLGAVGRLLPGVTAAQAQADLDSVAAQLAADFPASNSDRGVQLFSLRDWYLGSTRALVLAVFAAVGLLLFIACANVAGLLLVRAAGRRRETALRLALGAGRGRIVQALVVEGLLLALAAAALGLVVAQRGLQGLTLLAPAGVLPAYATPELNWATFGFTLLVAAGCGIVVGLAPALRSGRLDLVDALKQGARGSAAGFGRGRRLGAQQLLVVAETAVALVLLVGAGLFVRSLQRELAVAPGFDPRGLLRARLVLPQRYTPEMRRQLALELDARLGALPGVGAVALGSDLPLGGSTSAGFIYVPEAEQSVRFYRHSVAPGFFSALGIRLVEGRAFTAADRDGAPAVVVVNESMARRFWPEGTPVGRSLRLGAAGGREVSVVGVVADARQRDLTTPLATTEPDVYFALPQLPSDELQVAVRSALGAETVAAAVRRELQSIDPTIPLFGVQPMEALLAQQTSASRLASSLLAVFAAAALLLTAVGLYGVLAFVVSLRQREIGIRLALGATRRRVLGGVMRQGLRLVASGLAIGVLVAAGATRGIANLLYGVGAHDPVVFAGVPAVLLAVAALASWVPARRAAGIDPLQALRSE